MRIYYIKTAIVSREKKWKPCFLSGKIIHGGLRACPVIRRKCIAVAMLETFNTDSLKHSSILNIVIVF
jgi:hypothetical protein